MEYKWKYVLLFMFYIVFIFIRNFELKYFWFKLGFKIIFEMGWFIFNVVVYFVVNFLNKG